MQRATGDAHAQVLLFGKKRLEDAPPAAVDGRVRVGEHDHARRRLAAEHTIEWRVSHPFADDLADVEVLRVGEKADVRALALVRPRLERVVDKLEYLSG